MRGFLIVLLVAFNSTSALSQQNNSDTAVIQSIRVEKVKSELKSGKWEAGKIAPSSVQTYDNSGNLVESIVHKEGGDVYVKYTAKYNDADMKIEDTYFDAKDAVLRRTIYQYDGDKQLMGMLYFDSKNSSAGESTIRHKAGRINELITYGKMGVVTARTVYTYYDNERKVERRHYGIEGFNHGEILTFDERGRLKESNSYVLDASDGNRTLYQRDRDGHITEKVFHVGSDTVTWRYSYEFDAKGKWITRIITAVSDSTNEPNPNLTDFTKRTIRYGAGENKPKQSTSRSLAQFVESDVAESTLNSSELKRNVPSLLLSSLRLNGQAHVFIVINELGKVILSIPFGRVRATRVKVSADKVRKILENSVKDWKYTPTVEDGEPLSVPGIINFNFKLR